MNTNSNVKKITQVSEEAQNPIHVPVVFGNECFIVTQQDVRQIVDTRLLTYSKLTSNGQLIPMDTLQYNNNVTDAILNACKYASGAFDGDGLSKFLQQRNTDVSSNPNVATINQQLHWGRSSRNTSPPFPFTCSTSTSTTEIPKKIHFERRNNDVEMCNRACNTMNTSVAPLSAHEQLKQKKMDLQNGYGL